MTSFTQLVRTYFECICAIPHGSGNEKALSDYVFNRAKEKDLDVVQDGLGNVFVRLPASVGKEKALPLLLQGHLDMVCEKEKDHAFDFLHDGLHLIEEGDGLRADRTTLGADDGVAVSTMLALMDDNTIPHPLLELLFTVSEEVGLDGAKAFDYRLVHADRLINMDSEELGVVTSGCAGGVRTELFLKKTGNATLPTSPIQIAVDGLCGGHSGCDIHLGRQNANMLLLRLLQRIYASHAFQLVSLEGGSKDNAIPRYAFAVIDGVDLSVVQSIVSDFYNEIQKELVQDDRLFSMTCEKTVTSDTVWGYDQTQKVLSLSHLSNGVMAMSADIDGLVQTSRNLGVITTEDNGMRFVFSSRSSIENDIDASIAQLNETASNVGATVRHYARYPGWAYQSVSPLREKYLSVYKKVTGKDCAVTVVHAGLECGIIASQKPNMDMISVGPDIIGAHSPQETLRLSSLDTFLQVLLQLLAEL